MLGVFFIFAKLRILKDRMIIQATTCSNGIRSVHHKDSRRIVHSKTKLLETLSFLPDIKVEGCSLDDFSEPSCRQEKTCLK